jgi:hypothetical protein
MDTTTLVMLVILGVLVVAYSLKRRARLRSDE